MIVLKIDELDNLADSWDGGEDEGVQHVVTCRDYRCPDCAAIACATDLRAALATNPTPANPQRDTARETDREGK